ncbi:ABC transporter permease [Halalkalibacterium halodurans]|uniref:ABC transporter permease n=1 Tax=Halalkalibacterium halodurans TaxID=86665 RepID=UPI002AAA0F85|nr:ABC transporter permease subunit [Halalkalibacterium halodurans]MDY7223289.1 ABC transporter permease subunit [Halalkalibacterium halodurans]MDY7242510.1 ABC transporter permease subunit [Halalkalibacterium halodurans]
MAIQTKKIAEEKALKIKKESKLLLTQQKRGKLKIVLSKNMPLFILTLPALIYFILFHYAPMFGVVMAFKDFKYNLGILGSPWVGFKNFEFFFTSNDAWRILRNTVGYSILFIVVTNGVALIVALLLNEIKNKLVLKIHQTAMLMPHFLSWVLVGFITYIFLSPMMGVLNQFLEGLGLEGREWYSEPGHWPYILTVTSLWKGVGLQILFYYAALLTVDPQLYEAARIDGANKLKQAWYISIPAVLPIMTILMILAIGDTFRGDFGLFYQIPRDVGLLYSTTDIIDTYIFRGLRTGDMGVTAAVGLFQSVVGLILILIVNWIVKKIKPENALF